MAIRDYWVYQKRNVPVPWALYIVKEYDRRHPEKTQFDYTIYHENIGTQTHSRSFVGLHYPHVRGYADAVSAEINEIVEFTAEDYEQLIREFEYILLN